MITLADLAPYAEGLFLGETLQDWDQTREMLALDHDQHTQHENNPLLGRNPSLAGMTAFGVGADALQLAGYGLLPKDYKFPYAAGSALLEGANVLRNKSRAVGKSAHWNYPLVGLGALMTGGLVHHWNEKHPKHPVSIDVEQGKDGPIPKLSMDW